MEGTVPINLRNMEGTRPPTGASPTQPYKCGQNVKVKIKIPPTGDPRAARFTYTTNQTAFCVKQGAVQIL